MPDEEKARHDSEYQSLLALFISLLKSLHTESEQESLYELAKQRADIAISYAIRGMGIDMDTAMQLLQSEGDENLTQHDKDIRDRLLAAIRNLAEFSVCEEYHLYNEVQELLEDVDLDFDIEEYGIAEGLCKKYNDTYMTIENSDIQYAMSVAAWWIGIAATDYLVYWTQNDIKVRPWHMALQGYAAPKNEFPEWMIPPIEWNCRCYLETFDGALAKADDIKKVVGSAKSIQKPQQLDGVFSESVAKCGRIFGTSHPYFSVKETDKDMLQDFVARIKQEYHA